MTRVKENKKQVKRMKCQGVLVAVDILFLACPTPQLLTF